MWQAIQTAVPLFRSKGVPPKKAPPKKAVKKAKPSQCATVQLHWPPLGRQLSDGAQLLSPLFHCTASEESSIFSGDRYDIEREAIVQIFKKKQVAASKTLPKLPTRKIRPSALGPGASQRITIALNFAIKRVGSLDALKRNFLNADLDTDTLNVLMDIVPDMADARKFQDWSTLVKAVRAFRAVSPDTSLLDDEAFVFFFDQVPDAHFRLECMVIRNSFGSITASLSEKVKVLLRGVQLLRSSEKLKVLFNSILYVGNVLNEGTPLGDRPAFKLQTLAKLFSLKGTAAGTSATLATFLAEQGGAIFDADELTSLGHAQKTSLVHVYTSVISLIETHSLITDKETPYPSVDGLPDNFFRAMVSFGEESAGPVDDLLKRTSELLSAYVMLCQYIGDVESFLPVDKKDGKNVVPDVFAMMVPFLLDYHSLLKSIRPKDSQQSRKRFPETSKADPEKRVKSTSAVNHQPTVSPASPEPRTISFASEPPPTMFAPSFARELKPAKNLAFGRKATNPFGRSPANPAPARRRMSIMNVLNMASEVAPVSFSVTRAKIGGTVLFPKGLSDVKDPIEEEESDESEESENCNVIDLSLFQK